VYNIRNMKSRTYSHSFHIPKGMTLMEVVVIITIMSIFFLVVTGAFYAFSRGVQYTKSRILANSLAAEKIEILKNISYYRLMATKEADLALTGYDQTYYPPEDLLVGDIMFRRTVAVYKVYEDDTGKIVKVTDPDTSSDTDLKQIKVTVSWDQGGEQKSITIENLRENPDRVPLGGKIWGYVTSTGTIAWGGTTSGYNNSSDNPPADRVRLGSARVYVYENPAYEDYADSTGKYEIKLPTGTWKLVVSKSGYWDYTTTSLSVPSISTGTRANIQLIQRLTGIVTGFAVINDHLVISQIVASTVSPEGFDQEYVELYNPTTWQWIITDTSFDLKIHTQNPGKRLDVYLYDVPLNFVNTSIQPNGGYYLIANTPTVIVAGNIVTADAYYSGSYYGADLIEDGKAGAVVIANDYGVAIDSVGWAKSTTYPSAGWYEYGYPPLTNGIEPGYALIRASYLDTSLGGARGRVAYNSGNAHDIGCNYCDFYLPGGSYSLITSTTVPRNRSTVIQPVGGTPALGAIVTADDGLSSGYTIPYVVHTGTGYFEMTVATGTWTVMISSGQFFMMISSVNVLTGQRTCIPNNLTDPKWSPWPPTSPPTVRLTSSTTYGYVSGRIGVSVSGIKVTSAEAPYPAFTNSSGRYMLPILISETTSYYVDIYVTANPYPDAANNPSYTTETATATVYLGQITTVDFTLSQAGKIRGMVATSAVNPAGNPLPGVVLKATKGTIVNTTTSDTDGKFVFLNLSTGIWTVEPVLDEGESSSPVSVSSPVAIGQTVFVATFVVTGAYGKFYGTVKENGELIKSGVLILATTTTIDPNDPPAIDMTNPPSTPLYFTVSDGKGNYVLPVRGGYSYNIYAWLTKAERYQVIVSPKTAYTGQSIQPNESKERNITWP